MNEPSTQPPTPLSLPAPMAAGATRLGLPLPERVVIVRMLPGLGDMLCLVPALRALRRRLPQARFTLLGLPWARAFAGRYGRYIDSFLEFPGYPGIPERDFDAARLRVFLDQMARSPFDLALQMHGSGLVSNPFTALLGAGRMAGFYLPGMYCPDPNRFLTYPADEPEIWRHLRLLEWLGVEHAGDQLEFPVEQADTEQFAHLGEAARLSPRSFVCLHPGASAGHKRWPAERFASVADWLSGKGYSIVLTGTRAESDVVAAVSRSMRARAISVAGQTTLGTLGVLLSRARLLVSNDTGVVHLAAAVGLGGVVIFMAADPHRWAPLDRARHRALGDPLAAVRHEMNADPVSGRCLRDGCMRLNSAARQAGEAANVSVDAVIGELESLLNQEVR